MPPLHVISEWNAQDITLEDFLKQAEQKGIASFQLGVYPEGGENKEGIYHRYFWMDASGYDQNGALLISREEAFLRSIAYRNWTCQELVPLISSSPWRALFQEIAFQAAEYATLAGTRLKIELPHLEEPFLLEIPTLQTAEGIYARLREWEAREGA